MSLEQKPMAVIYEDAYAGAAKKLADTLAERYNFATAVLERPQGASLYLLSLLQPLAPAIIFYHANKLTDEPVLMAIHEREIPLVVLERMGGAVAHLNEMYTRLSVLSGRIKVIDRIKLAFELDQVLSDLGVV